MKQLKAMVSPVGTGRGITLSWLPTGPHTSSGWKCEGGKKTRGRAESNCMPVLPGRKIYNRRRKMSGRL